MKKLIQAIIVTIALAMFVASCTPKSARMTKAVIIDSKQRVTDSQYSYKVKLLTYGAVDYIISYNKYEVNDTVLIHNKWYNYDIK